MISRECGSDSDWILTNILTVFKTELIARERCFQIGKASENSSSSSSYHRHTNTFNAQANSPTKNCVFCRLPHPSAKCDKITEVHARVNILRKGARCFLCLQQGHMQRDCDKKYTCHKCNKKHHISLCTKDTKTSTEERNTDKPTTTAVTMETSNEEILLQTATAHVTDTLGKESIACRILFDTGSQRTYICLLYTSDAADD